MPWPELFTPWGKPLQDCDRAEVEAALARLPALGRLLTALAHRLPPVGTVKANLTPRDLARFAHEAEA